MKTFEEIIKEFGILPEKALSELTQEEIALISKAFNSSTLDLEGKTVEELEELLDEYENNLCELESEEPEAPDSKEYEEWEEEIEALQDKIDEIAEAIDDLEDESDAAEENIEGGVKVTFTIKPGVDVDEQISLLKSLLKSKRDEE